MALLAVAIQLNLLNFMFKLFTLQDKYHNWNDLIPPLDTFMDMFNLKLAN